MSSKMGDIWENYDLNAEVGMENKDIVNIKIDGRVLLSAASDTKVEFVDNGRKKNSKKCRLTGVLVTFRGLAEDGSNHEYNGKYMSIGRVWFINRMFLLEEARKAGYQYSACKDLEEERTYKIYKVMNEEYRYNDDNIEEQYGSGEINEEEYDAYVPRERMTIRDKHVSEELEMLEEEFRTELDNEDEILENM